MYESKQQKVISRRSFASRMATHVLLCLTVAALAVGIGVLGYHFIAGFDWLDSFLEASMILSGEGPVRALQTTAAKTFAACYALFSGLVFLSLITIMMAPIIHRILHRFHMDEMDDAGRP